jgi:hypothetical protein
MHFLATARIVHRDGFDEHLPEERRVFDELRAEGVIEEVFVQQAGSRCGQRRRSAEPGARAHPVTAAAVRHGQHP